MAFPDSQLLNRTVPVQSSNDLSVALRIDSYESSTPPRNPLGLRTAKQICVSISAANLLLLRIWNDLFQYNSPKLYVAASPLSARDYSAAIVNQVILSVLIYAGITIAGRRKWGLNLPVGALGLLAGCAVILNGVRGMYSHAILSRKVTFITVFTDTHPRYVLIAGVGCAVGALFAFHRRLSAAAAPILLLLFPWTLVNTIHATWLAFRTPAPMQMPLAAALARIPVTRPRPRVVWIIFDELDQRLAFDCRPSRLRLNNFDRFRNEALYGARAFPPARDTRLSVPSLVTGRLAEDGRSSGPDKFIVRWAGTSAPSDWAAGPTIFRDARELGLNASIAGWYFPYCRLFSETLTACVSCDEPQQRNSFGNSIFTIVPNQLRSLVESASYSPFSQSLTQQKKAADLAHLTEIGAEFAADPQQGLVFLHFPVPHMPYPFHLSPSRFGSKNYWTGGYFESLELADGILARIRSKMETSAVWSSTTVVISSDHFFRNAAAIDGKTDYRVPFMVKVSGDTKPLPYPHELNTLVTRELINAVLHGRITSNRVAAEWLAEHEAEHILGDYTSF
mgnify:CR=1 FL=1